MNRTKDTKPNLGRLYTCIIILINHCATAKIVMVSFLTIGNWKCETNEFRHLIIEYLNKILRTTYND